MLEEREAEGTNDDWNEGRFDALVEQIIPVEALWEDVHVGGCARGRVCMWEGVQEGK